MPPYSDPKPVRSHNTKGNNSSHTDSNPRTTGNAGSGGKFEQHYVLLARPWPTHYDSTSHIVQSESREIVHQDLTPMERWSQEQSHQAPWNAVAAYSTTRSGTEPGGAAAGQKKEEQAGSWSVQAQDGSVYEQY